MEWGKQFCGIKMSSNYQTLDLISRVLDANSQVKRIIEIGTFTGSLSIYLALEALRKKVEFMTWDIKRQHSEETARMFALLDATFVEADVFERRDSLFFYFDAPLFLLCDGGLKYEEFRMCVPQLQKNSIVAVHDYGTEFLDEHWMGWQGVAEPIMREEWTKEDVRLALFKIK